jgi:crossover junction endonuclease MUS81
MNTHQIPAVIQPSEPLIPSGCRTILLPPSSYSIELLLDNREVRSKTDRTYLQDGLLAQGIKPTTRALELGDCTWVARVHDPAVLQQLRVRPAQPSSTIPSIDPSSEFVLDHVVERKRLDDLIASLKDGRYHEQKFRLRRSGVKHVTYLIEEVSLSTEVAQRWHAGVRSALASTLVVDQFAVVRTKKLDDSIRWLARTTKALRAHYQGKAMTVLPESSLDALEEGARTRREAETRLAALRARVSEQASSSAPAECSLATAAPSATNPSTDLSAPTAPGIFLSYPAFSSRAAKQDGLALRDVFLKMLLCTRGVSVDKALAVQQIWPTPRALVDAYREDGAGSGEGSRGVVRAEGSNAVNRAAPTYLTNPNPKRADLLFRATAQLPGRQKIGRAVSVRVAEVWGGLLPPPESESVREP